MNNIKFELEKMIIVLKRKRNGEWIIRNNNRLHGIKAVNAVGGIFLLPGKKRNFGCKNIHLVAEFFQRFTIQINRADNTVDVGLVGIGEKTNFHIACGLRGISL